MKWRLIGLLGVLCVCLLVWLFYIVFVHDDCCTNNDVGDHQTATNSNHVAVMEATTLGRLMVLKDALSPYFSP